MTNTQDDRPCRHACSHYDCKMDRGEPLPAHVTAYREDGTLYVPDSAALMVAQTEPFRGSITEFLKDPIEPGSFVLDEAMTRAGAKRTE